MRRVVITAVVTALVAAASTAAIAINYFPDVPDSHPFHDEIGSLAAAGITEGFADGTFRPSQTITRQAMSAFVERGFGRLQMNDVVNDNFTQVIDGTPEIITVTGMEAGASGSGSGYVFLSATGTIAQDTGCPCLILIDIINPDGVYGETQIRVDDAHSFALQGAANIAAGEVKLYGVRVTHIGGQPGDEVSVKGDLAAIYIPFDASAMNTTVYPRPAGLEYAGFDLDDLPAPSFELAVP